MQSKRLVACLDTNVLISALGFGGVPLKVMDHLWIRSFFNVTSPLILEELKRNLSVKLALTPAKVERFLFDLMEASSVLTPTGTLKATGHAQDDLVLETAMLGGCDVLVTGDKRHLLPLNPYQSLIIEPPSAFLKRLAKSVVND